MELELETMKRKYEMLEREVRDLKDARDTLHRESTGSHTSAVAPAPARAAHIDASVGDYSAAEYMEIGIDADYIDVMDAEEGLLPTPAAAPGLQTSGRLLTRFATAALVPATRIAASNAPATTAAAATELPRLADSAFGPSASSRTPIPASFVHSPRLHAVGENTAGTAPSPASSRSGYTFAGTAAPPLASAFAMRSTAITPSAPTAPATAFARAPFSTQTQTNTTAHSWVSARAQVPAGSTYMSPSAASLAALASAEPFGRTASYAVSECASEVFSELSMGSAATMSSVKRVGPAQFFARPKVPLAALPTRKADPGELMSVPNPRRAGQISLPHSHNTPSPSSPARTAAPASAAAPSTMPFYLPGLRVESPFLRHASDAYPAATGRSQVSDFRTPSGPLMGLQPYFSRGDLTPRIPSLVTEQVLEDEDWMLDPRTQDLLHVRDDARHQIASLRREAQSRVLWLRQRSIANPQIMSFEEKMAFFTTAGLKLHPDIEDVVAESSF